MPDPAASLHLVDALRAALQQYARVWPDERAVVAEFLRLLDDAGACEGNDPFARTRLTSHFTGSAWLVDAAGARVLLTHHRKLDRWLQLGGHADGERDLAAVALKEAEEESGLHGLTVEAAIFDLDRHWIPERGEVPSHWHYDARYVVRAGAHEAFVVSDESHALAWCDIATLVDDPGADASLRRMATKWQQRHLP